MSRALDSDRELTLLFCAEAGLCDGLDATVRVDVALEIFDVFVVKVCCD